MFFKKLSISKRISGFSTIELLIAFALVAILATMSIPTYSKFRVKSKTSNMFNLLQSISLYVSDEFANNNFSLTGISYSLGSEPFITTNEAYISNMAVTNGVIVITGASANLGNRTINLTYTPTASGTNLSWVCTVNNSSFNEFVPVECRI